MAIDKTKLLEKLKGLSPEDRGVFREVLDEIEPPDPSLSLSPEEVTGVREILEKRKTKKKGFGELLDSLFD